MFVLSGHDQKGESGALKHLSQPLGRRKTGCRHTTKFINREMKALE